jgi:chorismate lyase/3-hydroxybenzoate synthase
MLPGATSRCVERMSHLSVVVRESVEFCLVTACVADARHLSADQFHHSTAEIYRLIERELRSRTACYPVRIWNHLPDIHASGADGADRYMAFNAGRYQAYSQWLGGAGDFDRTVPTASAVGHDGDDLVIHALGSRTPGIAVANPRQIAPHRYSKRFGPKPPCFARATVLPAGPQTPRRIFVGGTASIRGEESIYLGDLARQTQETFDNLAHLIRAAVTESASCNGLAAADAIQWLGKFRNLRIYYVREADRALIEAMVSHTFAPSCAIEYVRANLCRAELLVEIEGLAEA